MSDAIFSLGLGVGTHNSNGQWLEVFYPAPAINVTKTDIDAIASTCGYQGGNEALAISGEQMKAIGEALANSEQKAAAASLAASTSPLVVTILATDAPPTSVPEGYLKLHLLSHRLVKPHGTDLTGLFGVLPNVAWTNQGAIDINELPQRQLQARIEGSFIEVISVDKFPKMTSYVVPTGVRIAHTARVRLGAHLGEGTTIMHEGFVNFNAGTAGTSMVEGRITAGVFVGNGSDLGGGCSIMGTLSGGGNLVNSIGEDCLIGANAGSGIPLGDRCTIEAGLYITAGTKVNLIGEDGKVAGQAKARDLASQADLLFRRNSLSGAVECLTNNAVIELNEALHSNN